MSDLPTGWTWATLEELLAVEDRAITDGPFGSKLASRHYTMSGARVIRLQNIGDCIFNDERAYIVRHSKPPYWGASRAQLNISVNFATRRMR
jgi:hypothetical protein